MDFVVSNIWPFLMRLGHFHWPIKLSYKLKANLYITSTIYLLTLTIFHPARWFSYNEWKEIPPYPDGPVGTNAEKIKDKFECFLCLGYITLAEGAYGEMRSNSGASNGDERCFTDYLVLPGGHCEVCT